MSQFLEGDDPGEHATLRAAVDRNPDDPQAHLAWGSYAARSDRREEALQAFHQALRLDPDSVEAQYALALALTDSGRFEEADPWVRRLRQSEPGSARGHYLEGHWLSLQGDLEAATKLYERAVELAPDVPKYHRVLCYCYMASGDFDRGWEEHEWRLVDYAGAEKRRLYRTPLWDGSSTDGETLLVHSEQGMGDIIQYARFIPELRQRHALPVVFVPPKPLARLLQNVEGMCPLALPGQRVPKHSHHLPLLSLPRLLGTRLDNIPLSDGYIRDSERLQLPVDGPERLGLLPRRGLRVGICWQGNPQYHRDKHRSCGLQHFLPLSQLPGVDCYALQFGAALNDLERTDHAGSIRRLTQMPKDYAGTAMIVRHLDLVISVDTSLVHLAGAMGIPTWVALPHPADWRWLRERSDSPWYASVRLYRQKQLGNWNEPFEDMRQDLERLAVSRLRLE